MLVLNSVLSLHSRLGLQLDIFDTKLGELILNKKKTFLNFKPMGYRIFLLLT